MSLFGSIAHAARGALKGVSAVGKVPFVGNLLKAVPIVGTAISAASLASDAYQAFGGSSSSSDGLPALAARTSGGLPALPGSPGSSPIVGKRGVFRNDANVPDALKSFVISKPDLRQYYRAPMKGYVIRHDSAGDPYALPKKLAKAYMGYKAAKKPPISVGEYESLKKAHRTIKKVRKIHGLIHEVNSAVTPHGQVIVHKRAKKGGHTK
jgi:hypothetical protein